jgi:hypothetical protein
MVSDAVAEHQGLAAFYGVALLADPVPPTPSPLVPRGEGEKCASRMGPPVHLPSPTQFVGEGPGMGGARPRTTPTIRP